MIARRRLLIAGLCLVAVPTTVTAQQARTIPRVAWISATKIGSANPYLEAFRQGMRDLGYIDGKNVIINAYGADGNPERLAGLATEIVALKPDVIVAVATSAIRAVQQATKTIPLIMSPAADPVGSGFVISLARPGGNITGVANLTIDLSAKTVELLREVVPKATRIAILRTDNPTHLTQIKEIQDVASARGLTVFPVVATSAEEIDKAFALMAKQRPQALIVLADAMLVGKSQRIADLAMKQKWPSVHQFREHAVAGGLMSYGPRLPDLYRRSATYVDKILKGAKPAEIPVEQPMAFELVINRKTAKALGLAIPQALLLRADEVIE